MPDRLLRSKLAGKPGFVNIGNLPRRHDCPGRSGRIHVGIIKGSVMVGWSRRKLLASLALAAAGEGAVVNGWQARPKRRRERASGKAKLALEDYEPKILFFLIKPHLPRARFSPTDFHSH